MRSTTQLSPEGLRQTSFQGESREPQHRESGGRLTTTLHPAGTATRIARAQARRAARAAPARLVVAAALHLAQARRSARDAWRLVSHARGCAREPAPPFCRYQVFSLNLALSAVRGCASAAPSVSTAMAAGGSFGVWSSRKKRSPSTLAVMSLAPA